MLLYCLLPRCPRSRLQLCNTSFTQTSLSNSSGQSYFHRHPTEWSTGMETIYDGVDSSACECFMLAGRLGIAVDNEGWLKDQKIRW